MEARGGTARGGGDSAAPAEAAPAAEALYSITSHFDGACNVLLTGASGYIGSLVLEKLLRSTNVGRVYVLLRPRRGVAPADRLAKLLTGPLFHLLDETHAERVTAVAGDILEPGLGLSAEDEAMLVANVDTVIHSAAGESRRPGRVHTATQPAASSPGQGPKARAQHRRARRPRTVPRLRVKRMHAPRRAAPPARRAPTCCRTRVSPTTP